MSKKQWAELVMNTQDSHTIDGAMMQTLALLPELLSRGRQALKTHALTDPEVIKLRTEAQNIRRPFLQPLGELRERWQNLDVSIESQYPSMINMQHGRSILHAHYSRSYGMALAVAAFLGRILMSFGDESEEIKAEGNALALEAVELAYQIDGYRPLGTMYMMIVLAAAWVASSDDAVRQQLQPCIVRHATDMGNAAQSSPAMLRLLDLWFTLKPLPGSASSHMHG